MVFLARARRLLIIEQPFVVRSAGSIIVRFSFLSRFSSGFLAFARELCQISGCTALSLALARSTLTLPRASFKSIRRQVTPPPLPHSVRVVFFCAYFLSFFHLATSPVCFNPFSLFTARYDDASLDSRHPPSPPFPLRRSSSRIRS